MVYENDKAPMPYTFPSTNTNALFSVALCLFWAFIEPWISTLLSEITKISELYIQIIVILMVCVCDTYGPISNTKYKVNLNTYTRPNITCQICFFFFFVTLVRTSELSCPDATAQISNPRSVIFISRPNVLFSTLGFLSATLRASLKLLWWLLLSVFPWLAYLLWTIGMHFLTFK